MRVLFATDTNTVSPPNPFLISLVRSLAETRDVEHVSYGARLLFWDLAFDVVHFNWPETLFGWRPPSSEMFAAMEDCLTRRKRDSAFVTTVHNLHPPASWPDGEKVLELVYSRTDAFVHLSEAAGERFRENYKSEAWCKSARHTVIPHGNFSYYRELPKDRQLARAARRGGYEGPIVLVFGAIRSLEEEAFARRAFQLAGPGPARLVFAGPPTRKLLPEGTVKSWLDRQEDDIVRFHHRVEETQVAPLVKTAKFVLIPRRGRINSGVIPLAYTFGIPVVAPDDEGQALATQGVGALLYATGDADSGARALSRGLSMDAAEYEELKRRIHTYCKATMAWPGIARQYAELYSSLRPARRRRWFRSNR